MKFLRVLSLILTLSISLLNSSIHAQCENDSIPPTAFTVNLSTAVLEAASNTAELYAIDFFIFAEDDCIPSDSLRYTFNAVDPDSDPKYQEEYRSSSKIFDCYDAVNSPVSVHVYAWDLAGNYATSTVSTTFVPSEEGACDACIMDSIPPTVLILNDIVWPFPEDADSVEIWASDFVWSASDNCTSTELLSYSFSPVSPNEDPSTAVAFFDCYDAMNSPIMVDIYTWDRHGNYTMLPSQLILQVPPGQDCTEGFTELSGSVIDLNGEPMPGATIFLERASGEILDETVANDLGQYSFIANTTNKYLRIEYNEGSSPELSFLDMVDIQQNLLGLNPYTTAQKMAADINGDGRVRVNDLRMMRKMILGIIPSEEHISNDWKFVDQNQKFGQSEASERIKLKENSALTIVGYRIGDLK